MKKLFLSLVLAFSSFAALAVGTSTGTITAIYAMPSGVMMFTSSGSSSGQPGCATSAGRFAIDTTTAAGKEQAASLMYAAAIGKTVAFTGLGTCAIWSDSEGLNYAIITN
jgi:hypothetical protein